MKCSAVGPKMLRCAKCKCTSYCSKECQRADWAQHKSECDEATEIARIAPAAASTNMRAMRSLAKAVVDARTDPSMIEWFIRCMARARFSAMREGFLAFGYTGKADESVAELSRTLKAAVSALAKGAAGQNGGWEVRALRKGGATFSGKRMPPAWIDGDYSVAICCACVPGVAEQLKLVSLYNDEPGRPSPKLSPCGCFSLSVLSGEWELEKCAEHAAAR